MVSRPRVELVWLSEGSLVVRIDGEPAVVRAMAESFGRELSQWVGATDGDGSRRTLADSRISTAMTLMTRDPAKRWTVESLARAVGLSRAAFARRFEAAARVSPLRYLARIRMLVAAALLRDSDASLAEIAARVGYESEFAFSRAFKRHHGSSPGVFRRSATVVSATTMRAAA